MKLIYCPECYDVVKLTINDRSCECGESSGRHLDNLYAEVSGPAIAIGFDNPSFVAALIRRPETGMGSMFRAFVIPKSVPTIRKRHDN